MIFTYKKLHYEYLVIDTYNSGIILEGWEIPSIKENGFGLNESYISFKDNKLILKNSYISPKKEKLKSNSNLIDYVRRDRELLLNKNELKQIKKYLEEKGLTAIASKIYKKDSLFKVEISICKGKKTYDKRNDIKIKDLERDQNRMRD